MKEGKRNDGADAPSVAETVIDCENETWRLIQQKDLQGFARYLADEFYDIFPDGTERNKAQLLEFLSGADLKEYHLSSFRVTMLNDNAAVVTYRVDARARIQGEEIALRAAVTAGWAWRGGRWVNVFSVGTPPT